MHHWGDSEFFLNLSQHGVTWLLHWFDPAADQTPEATVALSGQEEAILFSDYGRDGRKQQEGGTDLSPDLFDI